MGFFSKPDTAVLMVCTANICRSPMAEGVLRLELEQRGLQRQIMVDSAGTHAGQPGRAADARAQQICSREGIDISRCRARQVREKDFIQFDHILCMDRKNYDWLLEYSPDAYHGRISLIGAWGQGYPSGQDIPDPYYGNIEGFELVFAMLRDAVQGFLVGNL
jgi:protein-tyrosine phosphatase